MKSWMRSLSGAAVLAALAAGAALADASALEKFPGAKDAIMSYYAANAREPNCGAGQMQNIGDASVVSESGDQAVVAVNYTFSATPGDRRHPVQRRQLARVHPHQGWLGLGRQQHDRPGAVGGKGRPPSRRGARHAPCGRRSGSDGGAGVAAL